MRRGHHQRGDYQNRTPGVESGADSGDTENLPHQVICKRHLLKAHKAEAGERVPVRENPDFMRPATYFDTSMTVSSANQLMLFDF